MTSATPPSCVTPASIPSTVLGTSNRWVRRARLVRLVAHHSGAVYEAEQRGLSAELAVYEREDSPVLDALIFADMTTGPAGQSFDFDTRIDEILVRYEPGSEVHNAISKARPYLRGAVERTRDRMAHQPM